MRVILEAVGGIGHANQRQQLGRAFVGLLLLHAQMEHERFGYLHPNGQHRVERRHRVLEDHRHFPTAHAPQLFGGEFEQVAAVEHDLTVFDAPRWAGDDSHHRLHRHRFAGTALADDSHRFALVQLE